MIKTLLLDLDDTLLDNDIDRFLPQYLKRLGAHLNDVVASERMIPALLQGTQAMLENRDPERSLHQAFSSIFYPALETTEDDLRPRIEGFYRDRFPELRELTRPRPDARVLVHDALSMGLEVVIATSPLFPLTAIEQRLAWADVPAPEFPYRLITHYDNMHFCKPRPEYVAQILGLLGRSSAEAAMVGNNPEDDLAPARLLGMAVFHIRGQETGHGPGGDLKQALRWLRQAHREPDAEAAARRAALLAMLRGHLAAVHAMAARLQPSAWIARPSPTSMAPTEILCHLRDADTEVNLPRVEAILRSPDPSLSAVNTDLWIEERGYLRQSGQEALLAFGRARKELIGRLETLEEGQWRRTSRHALLGVTSLAEMIRVVIDHDRLHLAALRSSLPEARLD